MEQAANAIAAFHPAFRGWGDIGRSAGRPLPEALMRPSLVIVKCNPELRRLGDRLLPAAISRTLLGLA
jgi:hypothetical protein